MTFWRHTAAISFTASTITRGTVGLMDLNKIIFILNTF